MTQQFFLSKANINALKRNVQDAVSYVNVKPSDSSIQLDMKYYLWCTKEQSICWKKYSKHVRSSWSHQL